jgi:chromosome segregation ATPase
MRLWATLACALSVRLAEQALEALESPGDITRVITSLDALQQGVTDETKARLLVMNGQKSWCEDTVAEKKTAIEDAKDGAEQATTELQQAESEVSSATAKVEEVKKSISTSSGELSELEKKFDSKKAEYKEALKKLTEAREESRRACWARPPQSCRWSPRTSKSCAPSTRSFSAVRRRRSCSWAPKPRRR